MVSSPEEWASEELIARVLNQRPKVAASRAKGWDSFFGLFRHHLIGRGQFEVWTPVNAWSSYLRQMGEYLQATFANLGFFYGIAAIIPLCFLGKLKRPARGWVLGLVFTFTFFSLVLVAVLNFPPGSLSHNLPNYFSAADLILSMLAGYGLALLAATLHGRGAPHINMLPVCGKKN